MTRRRETTTTGPHLEHIEMRRLTEMFRAEAGLTFADDASFVLERRLRERLALLGLATFGQYVDYIRNEVGGRRELEEALELVTTHETYFFREDYQLRAFRDEVLPRLFGTSPQRKLTLWSAGCSTGEEAYSVAIVLLAAAAAVGQEWDVRIFGSDLSRRCVAIARRGVYGAAAFRAVPREYQSRYFVEGPEGTYVAPAVRARCSFTQLNLLDFGRSSVIGRVDAIFCRNVLIYLDADARQKVLHNLYERLVPGGFLMLGHSESLLNMPSAFEAVRLRDDLVYRKPEAETPFGRGGRSAR